MQQTAVTFIQTMKNICGFVFICYFYTDFIFNNSSDNTNTRRVPTCISATVHVSKQSWSDILGFELYNYDYVHIILF